MQVQDLFDVCLYELDFTAFVPRVCYMSLIFLVDACFSFQEKLSD